MVAFCSSEVLPETLAYRVSDAGYCCRVRQARIVDEYRAAGGDPAGMKGATDDVESMSASGSEA
jgi:hypothetical protein